MGKLVVSLDNVVIKEFQITKERTTLGRRPYNDIVIDNPPSAASTPCSPRRNPMCSSKT